MVGGGVRGRDDGIAHGTTIQVGLTIIESLFFMQIYPQAGGMTTGIIVGKGINGTINECLSNKFNGTGAAGKRVDIGKNNKLGVCKVCNPERDRKNRQARCNDGPDHKKER